MGGAWGEQKDLNHLNIPLETNFNSKRRHAAKEEEEDVGEEYTTEELHAAVVIEAWIRSRKVHWEVWRPMGIQQACACMLIQRVFRGMIGRRRARFMQMDLEIRAVLTLQRNFRGAKARKIYFAALKLRRWTAATAIQSVFRGFCGRRLAKE